MVAILAGMRWCLIVVLICFSLIINIFFLSSVWNKILLILDVQEFYQDMPCLIYQLFEKLSQSFNYEELIFPPFRVNLFHYLIINSPSFPVSLLGGFLQIFYLFIYLWERDVFSIYLCIHWFFLVCDLTKDRACNLGLSRRCPNQLSCQVRAWSF